LEVTVDYVNLGHSGLIVSRLCMGTLSFGSNAERPWVLSEEDAAPFVRRAIEAGINFFDTADSYNNGQSEVATGNLLQRFGARDEMVVATKVFMPTTPGVNGQGLSRKHIFSAIDASLTRLNMEYVDLYQIHRFDPLVPIEETMGALDEVVRAGKARYIGASSMYAWQFQKAQFAAERTGGQRFISMQNHYNLIYREEEREMLPLCLDQGVGVIPWSPLARGVLAGNVSRGGEQRTTRARTDTFPDGRYDHPSDFDVVDQVTALAARRSVPPAQVALAWLLHQPAVAAPIIGATKVSHIDDALAAMTLQLDADELASLEAPYLPHSVQGH
jgi:aryl-alcohol dehydrogenase-like predicted oxidoreductase